MICSGANIKAQTLLFKTLKKYFLKIFKMITFLKFGFCKSLMGKFIDSLSWQWWALLYGLDPLASEKFPIQIRSNPVSSLPSASSSSFKNGPSITTTTTTIKYSSWDFTFLLPMILLISSALYGDVYLVYAHQKNQNGLDAFDWKSLPSLRQNCSLSMAHQMFPPSIWSQCDVAWVIGVTLYTLVMATLLRTPLASLDRYKLVQKSTHKNLSVLSMHGKGKERIDQSRVYKSTFNFLIFLL